MDRAGTVRADREPVVLQDLAALIACRGDAASYARVVTAMDATMKRDSAAADAPDTGPGWTVREDGEYAEFIAHFDLPRAISVAGHRTRHVGFAGVAFVAYLDGVSPPEVARQLGLSPDLGNPGTVWLRHFDPVDGATDFRNVALYAASVEDDHGNTRRGMRARAKVMCEVQAEAIPD